MPLALMVFPMLALLAAAGLIACARREPRFPVMPTVRTVALISIAAVYVATIWSHT